MGDAETRTIPAVSIDVGPDAEQRAALTFRQFPVTLEIGGKVLSPLMLDADESATRVWGIVDAEGNTTRDGEPSLLLSAPATVAREQNTERLRVGGTGTRGRYVLRFDDDTTMLVGKATECCGCHKHPLCGFKPPVAS